MAPESQTHTRRGRARALAAGLGLATVLALVPQAHADTSTIRDPARDTTGGCSSSYGRFLAGLDIVRASAGHTSDGNLKHVVEVRKANDYIGKIALDLKVGATHYWVTGNATFPVVLTRSSCEKPGVRPRRATPASGSDRTEPLSADW